MSTCLHLVEELLLPKCKFIMHFLFTSEMAKTHDSMIKDSGLKIIQSILKALLFYEGTALQKQRLI